MALTKSKGQVDVRFVEYDDNVTVLQGQRKTYRVPLYLFNGRGSNLTKDQIITITVDDGQVVQVNMVHALRKK